jgi:hypothetical protein
VPTLWTVVLIARIRKALVAGVGAAGAALLQAGQDGHLDRGDAVTALVVALVVGGGVFWTKNAPKRPAGEHRPGPPPPPRLPHQQHAKRGQQSPPSVEVPPPLNVTPQMPP